MIGEILNEFLRDKFDFLICTSGENHQVNHLSRRMEWVVIFPEGAKHQVNHIFQDIDLVLIYRREQNTKLNTCPGGWNSSNLSKGTKLRWVEQF